MKLHFWCIFGGKAFATYLQAKRIVKFITDVGATINHDPEIGDLLKVVFVPDYIVSVVELLIPASELSQHIRTLDGANVEKMEEGEHEKQQVAHTRALEHAIKDWQGTEDFSRAADDYACSRMPGLLRYWLSSLDRFGQAMVDAMSEWHNAQDYQAYLGPPLVQVLQEWAVTAGGKSAMGPVAEVGLRDTDEVHARVVRECEAAFYLGQREMHDQLYGKLRRRFTSFSIAGWKLLEYLPLRRPPAPVIPASTTTPADEFLMSPERAGGTSSVALPSDPVGGSGAVGSVDPSLSHHFTSGSGFSGSAAGSAAP
nr:uncharacterized protein LOC109157428 [Ipomoea trifida]